MSFRSDRGRQSPALWLTTYLISSRGTNRRRFSQHDPRMEIYRLDGLTSILYDQLGDVQCRVRRHLYLSQVSTFEPHGSQLSRPIPWWVVTQDSSKEKELEFARLAVFRAERLGCLGVQETDLGDGNGRGCRGEVSEDAFLRDEEFGRRFR